MQRNAKIKQKIFSTANTRLAVQVISGGATRWWTGEDSNLRSPQGAADLQSAGFSHSPTRPHGGNLSKEGRSTCAKFAKTKDTFTFFAMQEPNLPRSIGILPLTRKILAELAEGFEPPTL